MEIADADSGLPRISRTILLRCQGQGWSMAGDWDIELHDRMRSTIAVNQLRARSAVWLLIATCLVASLKCSAAQAPAQQSQSVTIHGRVVDSAGVPVAGVLVEVETQSGAKKGELTTEPNGSFLFSGLPTGTYALTAEKGGMRTRASTLNASAPGDQPVLELRFEDPAKDAFPSSAEGHSMEFADNPNFTVAGITDWTAAGGHGSDAILRTSEELTRDTLKLKADGSRAAEIMADSDSNRESANLHRVAGENDEKLGNPLAAVHEYEEATRLDPSEQNYFVWGS